MTLTDANISITDSFAAAVSTRTATQSSAFSPSKTFSETLQTINTTAALQSFFSEVSTPDASVAMDVKTTSKPYNNQTENKAEATTYAGNIPLLIQGTDSPAVDAQAVSSPEETIVSSPPSSEESSSWTNGRVTTTAAMTATTQKLHPKVSAAAKTHTTSGSFDISARCPPVFYFVVLDVIFYIVFVWDKLH